jgi:hypothetical protein
MNSLRVVWAEPRRRFLVVVHHLAVTLTVCMASARWLLLHALSNACIDHNHDKVGASLLNGQGAFAAVQNCRLTSVRINQLVCSVNGPQVYAGFGGHACCLLDGPV